MKNLSSKVKIYLGRTPDFNDEVRLQDDRIDDVSNPYIAEWNATDKPQPTEEQLNNLETEADDMEALNQVYANRKSEYPSIEECVHAILDDDLENLQILRQAVKDKYPKENT